MKGKRDEFAEILNTTIVPSNLSMMEQIALLNSIQSAAKEILPNRLFRFRRCNEYGMQALKEDSLWTSTASEVNDGFDARILVRKEQVNLIKQELSGLFLQNKKLLDEKSDSAGGIVFSGLIDKIIDMTGLSYEMCVQQLEDYTQSITLENINRISIVLQETMKFCCFSEVIDSPYMWGVYSDDEKGFALEYSFAGRNLIDEEPGKYNVRCLLLPIIYSDKRICISSDFLRYFLLRQLIKLANLGFEYDKDIGEYFAEFFLCQMCPDITMPAKLAIHKSKVWENEAEWRLLFMGSNEPGFVSMKHTCYKKRPTAIYLGRRIAVDDERKIRDISLEKNIPVYKMGIDEYSSEYKLVVNYECL